MATKKAKKAVKAAPAAKKGKQVSVEAELLKATKAKPQGPKEDRQKFLVRLAEAVSEKIEEADFEKLSKVAQGWYTDCAKAAEANAEEMPDFAAETEIEEKPKKGGLKLASKGAKEEAPKKRGRPAKEAVEEKEEKPAKAKKAKKAKPEKANRWEGIAKDKVGFRNMAEAVRHIVATSPKFGIPFADMKEKLESRGFSGNESRIYDNFIHSVGTIKVLQELGKL